MQIHSVGVDLDKTTFHLVALGAAGKVLVRKNIVTTATAGVHREHADVADRLGSLFWTHFLGRALRKQGHDVRLIVAQFVKPFVKSNKNDYLDAEAIAEAVGRKNMRFVPLKTEDQLDLLAIHRVRDRLISLRTAVINQLPAFLLERGMVFAKTPAKLQTLAVRVDHVLRKDYLHRCRLKYFTMAKVAAARKLAIRRYWILRTQTPYPKILSSRVA